MKYYSFNNRFSYALITLSSLSVALWIVLLALHATTSRLFLVQLNSLFSQSISKCGYTYPLDGTATINSSNLISTSFTQRELIYTSYVFGYHYIYQRVSIFFLIVNGVTSIASLIVSILLLLRSRKPYKQACYLHTEDKLKTAINILTFFNLLCIIVYWGYTLNFNVSMKKTTCNQLLLYSQSYQAPAILGGVSFFIALCLYLLTVGIKQNKYLENKKNYSPTKAQQITKQNLLTIEASAEAQRIIAMRLSSLPKINQLKPMGMIESRQPSEFMMSETQDLRPYFNQKISSVNPSVYGNQFIKPPTSHVSNANLSGYSGLYSNNNRKPFSHEKQLSDLYTPLGRVRKIVTNPVNIQEIQINMDDRLQQLKARQQQRKLKQIKQKEKQIQKQIQKQKEKSKIKQQPMDDIEEIPEIQQRILDELYKESESKGPSKHPITPKKQRLKMFRNKSPVSDLKKQWGYT